MYAAMDVRELCKGISDTFVPRCCHANAFPLAPETRVTSGACRDFILAFQCESCKGISNIKTHKSVRLNVLDLDDDDDDAEPPPLGKGRRKSAKRKRSQTNGRPEFVVREVLACLLAGHNYSEYETQNIARGVHGLQRARAAANFGCVA